MKRFISFILVTVLLTVLGFHNSVMAFWGDINISMWNHSDMNSQMENCHEESISDCKSICCFDDNSTVKFSNINFQNNKKEFDKIKYSFIELSFEQSFIYEWNLIWNISPPIWELTINSYNYSSLTGIIKSII